MTPDPTIYNGHCSAISRIDKAKDELIVVDPYKDFADQDRILKIGVFLKRWLHYNELRDPQTASQTFKKDEQLFFVVVPLTESFPAELEMKSFY